MILAQPRPVVCLCHRLAGVAVRLPRRAVLQFLREFNPIFWMLPLMGFGQLSVFAVYAIYQPGLFPTSLVLLHGLVALPFLPETKGQPLPEE